MLLRRPGANGTARARAGTTGIPGVQDLLVQSCYFSDVTGAVLVNRRVFERGLGVLRVLRVCHVRGLLFTV